MEVKINKEIRDYTESIILGLSIRQCLFSLFACIVAIILYFNFIDLVGMEITSWICILGALPFAALGFIKYQEMNAEQIFIEFIRSIIISNRQLYFQPISIYYELFKTIINNHIKEDSISYDKKLRETKKERKTKD